MANIIYVVLEPSHQLQCCRVCLVTDVKLIDIRARGLDKVYMELTGIPVSPIDGLPQYLCAMCAELLMKSAAFRTKCRSTHALLWLQLINHPPITISYIRNLDRRFLKQPYTITEVFTMDLPGVVSTDGPESHARHETVKSNCVKVKPEKILKVVLNDILHKPKERRNAQIKDEQIGKTDDILVEIQEIKVENDLQVDNYNSSALDSEEKATCDAYTMTDKTSMRRFKNNAMDISYDIKKEISSDISLQEVINDSIIDEVMETDDPIGNFDDNVTLEEKTVEMTNSPLIQGNVISKCLDSVTRSNKSTVKRSKNVKINPKREKVKNYLILSSERSLDHHTKLFYDHILEKYFYKTKLSSYNDEEFESNDRKEENDPPFVRTEDDLIFYVNKNNLTETDSKVGATMKLYDYIRGKYIMKDPQYEQESKKIVDIDNMKSSLRGIEWFTSQCQTNEELAEFAKRYNFEFVVLSREEQIQDLHSRKDTPNYQNALYKCEKCFRGFSFLATYENHMTVHAPEHGSLVCELCQTRFQMTRSMRSHVLGHMRKFICKQCGKRCEWRNVRDHFTVHERRDYVCEHCGKIFQTQKARLNHVRVKHGSTPCSICYETFISSIGLRNHQAKTHKKIFQCATCDVPFDNKDALIKHIKTSPDDVCEPHIRPCAKCGENFAIYELEQLEEHIKLRHPSQERRYKAKAATARKKCCTCKSLRSAPNQDGDNVDHRCPCIDGEARCRCPAGKVQMCNVDPGSTVGPNYRRHRDCCVDKRERKPKTEQKCHQLSNAKPYNCSECCKSFRTRLFRQIHLRTHTGERPYKCASCCKAFSNKAALNRHVRVHTGVKPYACPECHKTFSQSNSMKLHVQTVHLKMPAPYKSKARREKALRRGAAVSGSD